MLRVLVFTLMAVGLHGAAAVLPVALHAASMPLLPGVVLVAYAALVEPPVAAALAASTLGLLVDALSGTPLGLHMLASLVALLVGRLAADWVSAPRGVPAFLFTATMAGAYHVVVVTLPWMFGPHPDEWRVAGFWSTAFWNGFAALGLFPVVQGVLVRLGLEEREETLSERLARRR